MRRRRLSESLQQHLDHIVLFAVQIPVRPTIREAFFVALDRDVGSDESRPDKDGHLKTTIMHAMLGHHRVENVEDEDFGVIVRPAHGGHVKIQGDMKTRAAHRIHELKETFAVPLQPFGVARPLAVFPGDAGGREGSECVLSSHVESLSF